MTHFFRSANVFKAALAALTLGAAQLAAAADPEALLVIKNHRFEPTELKVPAGQRGTAVREGSSAHRALTVAVSLAVLREGAETVLFVAGLGLASGAAADSHSMVLAAAMGLAAGVVLGLLTYFGLSRVKPQHLFGVTGAMLFLAGISYALYVIHPILSESWLGSGDVVEKYAKRPLLFAVLFALAYVSTYCYERPLIELGKKWFSPFQAPWRP